MGKSLRLSGWQTRRDTLESTWRRVIKAAASTGRQGTRDAALIQVTYRHGLRVSEVVALRWDQIDLKQGCYT